MGLSVKIHDIKNIRELEFELPLDKGLYAITGENGCGKSTLVACASTLFYHDNEWIDNFFGQTTDGAYIHFTIGQKFYRWEKKGNWRWKGRGDFEIKGFFEGSLIFGTRFKDTSYEKIKELDAVNVADLNQAPEFVRRNLGLILHGDDNHYKELRKLSKRKYKFDGDLFFYLYGEKWISQFHMSTGENLLISLLNSLYHRIKKLKEHNILFIDEIEIALHPAALRRLISFLNDLVKTNNIAIYFSTHSIELISSITAQNIFYVERYVDGTIDIINPCYPAFASRNLYVHAGYDDIILVEDDLAKCVVEKILKEQNLIDQRLVLVQPVGGFKEVIRLANDASKYNFLGVQSSIAVILDADVKSEALAFVQNNAVHLSNKINFLPIESLEKYLLKRIITEVDTSLYRKLNSYVFRVTDLNEIVKVYRKSEEPLLEKNKDKNGKRLFSAMQEEMTRRNISRRDLIDIVVEHIFVAEHDNVTKMLETLRVQLNHKSQ